MRTVTLAVMLAALMGCGHKRESPAPPNPDKALECVANGVDAGPVPDGGKALACASGEICLQGRCYTTCSADSDCGPQEMCASSGACVLRTMAGDGGVEGGVPCGGGCTAPTVCHELSGTCVTCNGDSPIDPDGGVAQNCNGTQPVCDVANGVCASKSAAPCAPCNTDADCTSLSFTGSCVSRDVRDVHERVCLPSMGDAGMCPAGLVPNGGNCAPPAGASCTTWRAAVTRHSCASDDECNPLGAVADRFANACHGASMPTVPDGGTGDAGPPIRGTCEQPCTTATDCFGVSAGQTCPADGGTSFCKDP